MKMNGQYRSFVKQVQVDLLALCDADLFRTVHQWMGGNDVSEIPVDIPEATRFALGYTRVLPNAGAFAHHTAVSDRECEEGTQWNAPSSHHLRTLLTTMDAHMFAEHVITYAFKALHPSHPEWYDGVTFNAHLANYLRRMRSETAR